MNYIKLLNDLRKRKFESTWFEFKENLIDADKMYRPPKLDKTLGVHYILINLFSLILIRYFYKVSYLFLILGQSLVVTINTILFNCYNLA